MVKAPLPLNASTNGGDASRVGFFSSLVPRALKTKAHTPNKGSQTALNTLSVNLCLNARRETRRPH